MGAAAENLDLDTTPSKGPVSVNGVKADLLQGKIQRIENLEKDKKGIAEDIKAVYQEAKAEGLDPKIMRKIIKLRATDAKTLEEEELLTTVYLRALGMID
jgi:uncharacterized protein (UPF0335 family)